MTNSNKKLKYKTSDNVDISKPWDKDNQAWWDWYVSLADNDGKQSEIINADPLPNIVIPSNDEVVSELAEPYYLTNYQIDFFKKNGFIKLKRVFSPGAVLKLRAELINLLKEEFKVDPDKGAQDRFLSLEVIWPDNALLRAYVLSPRLGQISADLLTVPAVRLYHDNVLAKQTGCGRTPWHFDDHHFPLDTNDVVTAWIPAQPIPLEMGPLSFAYPLDVHKLVNAVTFEKTGTGYDRKVSEVFLKNNVSVNETPFELGEVNAKLISAKELKEDEVEKIKKELFSKFGSKINLDYKVDKDLISGLIIQVESIMIDNSMKNKLKQIKSQMIEV